MLKEFRHVGITVQDLDRALVFFIDVLGFRIEKRMEEGGDFIRSLHNLESCEITTVKLRGIDGLLVELLKFKYHKVAGDESWDGPIFATGLTHLAFTVHDVDEIYQNAEQLGFECISEPKFSPDGYAKVMFCKSFEGLMLELVEIV